MAAGTRWTQTAVHPYGRGKDTRLAAITCLCYGCLGTHTARVILVRQDTVSLSLVTTPLPPWSLPIR